jgi:ribosomal protein S18 acetylase RimI-like enzyme
MRIHRPLPVRLNASHRPALEAHFLSLGPDDRRLRFATVLHDDSVRHYVAHIDFEQGEVFAVTDHDLAIVGVVHVALAGPAAELGLSVSEGARGRGVGNALFERAVVHLRNTGVRCVYMNCLAENQAMMHLARKHGMRIMYAGGDNEAYLALESATPSSYFVEWLGDNRANSVEAFKRNARLSRNWLALFTPG